MYITTMTQKHSMFKCQNRDILNVISKIQMLGVNKLVKLNHNNIHTKTNKRHLPEKIKTKQKIVKSFGHQENKQSRKELQASASREKSEEPRREVGCLHSDFCSE